MNIRILMLATLTLVFTAYSGIFSDKTVALHNEAVVEHKHTNLTEESHPILWGMVKNLAEKAHVPMPRYINAHGTEYLVIPKDGVVHTVAGNIGCWLDLLDDLHICRAILTDLSYEEVEGIIAVALAGQTVNKSAKIAFVGVSSYAATLAALYALNKRYDLGLWSFIFDNQRYYYSSSSDGDDRLKGFVALTLLPAGFTTAVTANNMQKKIDTQAAQLTSPRQVIQAIRALIKLEDKYVKENVISRIVDKLKLKDIFNVLFYPIRSFTSGERIGYLEKLDAQ